MSSSKREQEDRPPEWALRVAAHEIWQNHAIRIEEWEPGSMPYVIAKALHAAYLRGAEVADQIRSNARAFVMLTEAAKDERTKHAPIGQVMADLGCSEPALDKPVLVNVEIGPVIIREPRGPSISEVTA